MRKIITNQTTSSIFSASHSLIYRDDFSNIRETTSSSYHYDSSSLYLSFYIHDILNNIIGITDSLGNFIVNYSYDSYGKVSQTINTSNQTHLKVINHQPFRYKDYYYDSESGFYYLLTRYYYPDICRFISPDSINYLDPNTIGGLNLYSYCGNNPVNYCDPSGHFPILACILGITALIGMGLTIGGVASDNNLMTGIGLTMVAIPALISGGIAIAAGIGGATLTGIVGVITVGAGLGTTAFATAEYQEYAGAGNWIQDTTGMSDGLYNTIMISIAAIATLGTIASSIGSSFEIKSIEQIGRFGDYNGIRFTNASGKTRVLSFHTHGHVAEHGFKSIPEWHWQLQKWNPRTAQTAGTIAKWIWWNLTRM